MAFNLFGDFSSGGCIFAHDTSRADDLPDFSTNSDLHIDADDNIDADNYVVADDYFDAHDYINPFSDRHANNHTYSGNTSGDPQ